MPVVNADMRKRNFQKFLARDMVRIWNSETGEYLHLNGISKTADRGQSWLGFARQAQVIFERAGTRGEPLDGFCIIHRRHMEHIDDKG